MKFTTLLAIIAASAAITCATEDSKANHKSDELTEIKQHSDIQNIHEQLRSKRGTDLNRKDGQFRIHVTKKLNKRGKKFKTIHLYPVNQQQDDARSNDYADDDDSSDQETNETHTHEVVDDSTPSEAHHHKEEKKLKVKIKHHHHHHHHNHVKTIVKKEPYPVEKIVHVPKPYPVEKVVEKVVHIPKPYPVEKVVEKIVHVPVEKVVHVPIEKVIRVPYEKIVHVSKPYPVEKVVEKIVHVPKPYPVKEYIEKPIHIEKKVPYPVEKIVEVPKPYPVEKIVEKIVHVPKPYPVYKHVHVPIEVKVPVPKPYPVEKKVPYPVKVYVPQPHPAEKFQTTSGPSYGHHGYDFHNEHTYHGFESASSHNFDQHTKPSIQRTIAVDLPKQQKIDDSAQKFNGKFGQKTQHIEKFSSMSIPSEQKSNIKQQPSTQNQEIFKISYHHQKPDEDSKQNDENNNHFQNSKLNSQETFYQQSTEEKIHQTEKEHKNKKHKSTDDITSRPVAKVRPISIDSQQFITPVSYETYSHSNQFEPTYGVEIPEAMPKAEALTMSASNFQPYYQQSDYEIPFQIYQIEPYQTYQLPQGFSVSR